MMTGKAETSARFRPLLLKCEECKLNRLKTLLPSRADKWVYMAENLMECQFLPRFLVDGDKMMSSEGSLVMLL